MASASHSSDVNLTDDRIAALREQYENSDRSQALESAELETDVDPDPMVTTSLRLPRSLLQWIRAEAEHERMRPTALIRRWLEERQKYGGTDRYEQRIEIMESTLKQLSADISRIDTSGPAYMRHGA